MLRTARRLLLTAVVLTTVCVAMELPAALVFKSGAATHTEARAVEHPYHPYLGWVNTPSHTFTHGRCGVTSVIQSDGRGRSVTPHLDYEDPEADIVVLGGSTMFGYGSSTNETTVPSLIERELHERTGVRVEVHNLGGPGYASFQEMLALHRFMATSRVDIAVAISGVNDARYAAFAEGPEFGLLPDRVRATTDLVRSIERGELGVLRVGMSNLVGKLRQGSYAMDLLGKVLHRIPALPENDRSTRGGTATPGKEEIERRAGRSVTNWAMMDAMTKQNHAGFLLFLQPTASTKKTLTTEDKRCLNPMDPLRYESYVAVERTFYDAVRNCDKSFVFYDLTQCLDDLFEPAYVDQTHYRDVAARTIANVVCDVIAPVVVDVVRERSGNETLSR